MFISFAITLSVFWSLRAEFQGLSLSPDKHKWQQPSSISDSFPELISTNYWQFDYDATEQILLKIKHSKTGELILNANTVNVLERAVSKLPLHMKKAELQRVEFLVVKGLPGKAGQQLATVLTNYYQFQQASNIVNSSSNTPSNTTRNTQNKELSFQQTVLRQERYLGKAITQQLFGRQNALTHYLYARKHINESSILSQAQKQQQLTTLKYQFKAHEQ